MTDAPHILIVDDSYTVRMMLNDDLLEEGYRVTAHEDGEAAIAFLEQCERWPDLVLLDLVLPGADGIEVLSWIRANSHDGYLPVILLTALGEVDDRVRGLDRGADDYIAKPFENQELFARVRAQLRIKRLQEELETRNAALAAANMDKARLLAELEAKNEQLSELAATDALTGLPNRGTIETTLINEVSRSNRFKRPLSVAMVDVDHFKSINDTYGHPFGDRVLREVARILVDTIRQVDHAGRFGGEEFLLVLPDTGEDGALVLMERLRKAMAAQEFPPEAAKATLSVGIAHWDEQSGEWETLIARADEALYDAKRGGRNRVLCWSPQGHPVSTDE
ncbi:MAG: diguanylate cyclase [Nitrospirota bacterium]|nr:diguanylate cyclase [Nitrospirota bacterium]